MVAGREAGGGGLEVCDKFVFPAENSLHAPTTFIHSGLLARDVSLSIL